MKIINSIGWTGVFLILLAYTLISLEIVVAESLLYILLNIVGSAGIILSSWNKKDLQPVVLNIVWLAIAGFGLLRLIF